MYCPAERAEIAEILSKAQPRINNLHHLLLLIRCTRFLYYVVHNYNTYCESSLTIVSADAFETVFVI